MHRFLLVLSKNYILFFIIRWICNFDESAFAVKSDAKSSINLRVLLKILILSIGTFSNVFFFSVHLRFVMIKFRLWNFLLFLFRAFTFVRHNFFKLISQCMGEGVKLYHKLVRLSSTNKHVVIKSFFTNQPYTVIHTKYIFREDLFFSVLLQSIVKSFSLKFSLP